MEKKRRLDKRIRQAGFTLVELLLVVAILGILATVAIMNTGGMSTEARIKATRSTIAAIKTAIATHEIRNARYPNSLDELTQSDGTNPPLLEKTAGNDAWGVAFAYKKVSQGYEIRSAGPDAAMNTEDDITN